MGSLILLGAFGLFEWELRVSGAGLAAARTVAVNVVIIVELFYLFSSRSLERSALKLGLFTNKWIWLGVAGTVILQLLFTYVPFMQAVFETAPLSAAAWARILGFGALSFAVVEIEKALVGRARRTRAKLAAHTAP